jgi:hypothetical protein
MLLPQGPSSFVRRAGTGWSHRARRDDISGSVVLPATFFAIGQGALNVHSRPGRHDPGSAHCQMLRHRTACS